MSFATLSRSSATIAWLWFHRLWFLMSGLGKRGRALDVGRLRELRNPLALYENDSMVTVSLFLVSAL